MPRAIASMTVEEGGDQMARAIGATLIGVFCLAASPWWWPLAVAGGLCLAAGLIATAVEMLIVRG